MYTGNATAKIINTNVEKVAANGWNTLADLAKGCGKKEVKQLRREYCLHAQNSGLWLPSELEMREHFLRFFAGARWHRTCYKTQTKRDSRLALAYKEKHAATLKNARQMRESNRAGIILPF